MRKGVGFAHTLAFAAIRSLPAMKELSFKATPTLSSPRPANPVSDFFARWMAHGSPWRPPTDVYETVDAIVVRVEIAGMQGAS